MRFGLDFMPFIVSNVVVLAPKAEGSCRAHFVKGRPCQDSQELDNQVAPHLLGLFLVYVVQLPLD